MVNIEGGHSAGNAVIEDWAEGKVTLRIEACGSSFAVGMLRNIGDDVRKYEYDIRSGQLVLPDNNLAKIGPPLTPEPGMEVTIEVKEQTLEIRMGDELARHEITELSFLMPFVGLKSGDRVKLVQ
jgi:hypothetical protein